MADKTHEQIKSDLLTWLEATREAVQNNTVTVIAAIARGSNDIDTFRGEAMRTGYSYKQLELSYTVIDEVAHEKYLAVLNRRDL